VFLIEPSQILEFQVRYNLHLGILSSLSNLCYSTYKNLSGFLNNYFIQPIQNLYNTTSNFFDQYFYTPFHNFYTAKKSELKSHFSKGIFSGLANLCTSKFISWGIVPSLITLLSLVALGGTLALSTLLYAEITLSLSNILSASLLTVCSIVGLGIANFIFAPNFYRVANGAREIYSDEEYGDEKFKPHNIVADLVNEINERNGLYPNEYPKHSNHPELMKPPRLVSVKDEKFRITAIPGRIASKSMLSFTSGALASKSLSNLEFAALIQLELFKLRYRRNFFNIFVDTGVRIANHFEVLKTSNNIFYKALGYLAGPLQFFTLYQ